jgi:hypothetical protein
MASMADRAKQKFKPAGRGCTFNEWILSLDADDQTTVRDLVDDHSWTIEKLVNFFQDEGSTSSEKTISKHRRHRCRICDVSEG